MITVADGRRKLASLAMLRPAASPVPSGEERANRFIVLLLALQRLSYLVPPLVSLGSPGYRHGRLDVLLVLAVIAWNVLLFRQVRRRGWFTPGLVWTDIVVAAALMLAVTANIPAAGAYDSPLNWAGRTTQAAAALAGAALEPAPIAALGVLVLLAAHTVATVTTTADPAHLPGELATCLNGVVWFAVILGFGVRYLRRQGRLVDRLAAEKLAAESSRAAEHARHLARAAHYRALHDTVLATLVAVARGGLDHRGEQVRQRCARDADYVRRLMHDDEEEPADTLNEVVTAAEALGLRVHFHRDALPAGLASEVLRAVAEATREALNNVSRHAAVDLCWVSVTWEDEVLTVRVVDRGRGFDPEREPPGFGLSRSIADRMEAVGGTATVTSAPGDGTCVELAWPA